MIAAFTVGLARLQAESSFMKKIVTSQASANTFFDIQKRLQSWTYGRSHNITLRDGQRAFKCLGARPQMMEELARLVAEHRKLRASKHNETDAFLVKHIQQHGRKPINSVWLED